MLSDLLPAHLHTVVPTQVVQVVPLQRVLTTNVTLSGLDSRDTLL